MNSACQMKNYNPKIYELLDNIYSIKDDDVKVRISRHFEEVQKYIRLLNDESRVDRESLEKKVDEMIDQISETVLIELLRNN